MIRYHVFYKRTDGYLDCVDVYANDIGEAFREVKKFFKDYNYPVKEILGISKKDLFNT